VSPPPELVLRNPVLLDSADSTIDVPPVRKELTKNEIDFLSNQNQVKILHIFGVPSDDDC